MKGKFKSFLLASFRNYLSNEPQRARSFKREGNYEFISLNLGSAETRYRLESANQLAAGKIFDAPWAMTLLNEAVTLLRKEYATQEKALTFETLQVFLRIGDSKGVPSYEHTAITLGIGVLALKSLIHRLCKRYSAILREEVAGTVSDPAEVEGEIHALFDALTEAGGRLVQ